MRLPMLCLLLSSCGKLVDVQIPKKIDITYGPDFTTASKLCDERYGYKSLEAERCFQDYRTYLKLLSSVGNIDIVQFCSKYDTEVEQAACEENLNDFLTSQGN